jgi:hypothetical protein
MTAEYKGFSTFSHIDNKRLRAWNQTATFFNIIGVRNMGLKEAQKYLGVLSKKEREEVLGIYNDIKEKGYNHTRAAINRELQTGVFEHDL